VTPRVLETPRCHAARTSSFSFIYDSLITCFMASANTIPGMDIPGGYAEAASGGSAPWQELPPPKLFTNAFVFDATGRAVLLGYKKRGFGKDM
jgi:hypothetical protein